MKTRITTVLFLFICLMIPLEDTKAISNIEIMIDSEPLAMQQAPQLKNGTTFVPMRAIFEKLGATVRWEADSRTVIAEKGETSLQLTIEKPAVLVNGLEVPLSQPAYIHNHTTYIPIRFISETLEAKVLWNERSRKVTILTEAPNLLAYDEQQIFHLFGEPRLSLMSQYGFEWHIYHNHYKDFFQIGIQNDEVVALYAYDDAINGVLQANIGETKQQVEARVGDSLSIMEKGSKKFQYDRKEEWGLYEVGDTYYTVFYDLHAKDAVNALQIIEKETELLLEDFYGQGTAGLAQSFEIQFIELINAARVKQGLSVLKVDTTVTRSARNHSLDMATHNYFSHTNLEGESPFMRMEKEGLSFYMAGENIAMGQMSPIYAHEALMNSEGHRKNVLLPDYEFVGVGVQFAGNTPYYTQHFYK